MNLKTIKFAGLISAVLFLIFTSELHALSINFANRNAFWIYGFDLNSNNEAVWDGNTDYYRFGSQHRTVNIEYGSQKIFISGDVCDTDMPGLTKSWELSPEANDDLICLTSYVPYTQVVGSNSYDLSLPHTPDIYSNSHTDIIQKYFPTNYFEGGIFTDEIRFLELEFDYSRANMFGLYLAPQTDAGWTEDFILDWYLTTSSLQGGSINLQLAIHGTVLFDVSDPPTPVPEPDSGLLLAFGLLIGISMKKHIKPNRIRNCTEIFSEPGKNDGD